MLRQLASWLGPVFARWLSILFAVTAASVVGLQIAFSDRDWLLIAQLGVVWVFLLGLVLLLGARLPRSRRWRLWLALGPGMLLLALAVLAPDYALFWGGAGLGWMVAAQLVLRNRVRMEYQAAIKHLRQNDFAAATAIIDKLIRAEPRDARHYRFRAEVYRLAGKLRQAARDYERAVDLAPDTAAGYTGLAEVYIQQGDYALARDYALQAREREQHNWTTAYNLGMIADRSRDPKEAVERLQQAMAAGIPHSRYRLLAHLWLARSYHRQSQVDDVRKQVELMKRQAAGLKAWDTVFESEQAAVLRDLLEPDVRVAQRLLAGEPVSVLDEI
jgi:tetratricopeptide (TPR) repeat protein